MNNTTKSAAGKTPQELMDEFYESDPYGLKGSEPAALVHWENTIAILNPAISIKYVEEFSARGMRNVYGRRDHFGRRQPVFHLDIWKTKDGRLLARLWSRGSEVENDSCAVLGYDRADFPAQDERWVPGVLRTTYENWVIEMMHFA